MAASAGYNPTKSRGIKQLKVPFEFTTANTDAPTGVRGKGVSGVTRAGTGRFDIALREPFRRLAAFSAESIGTTYYKVNCHAVSNELSASAVIVTVVVLDGAFSAAETTSVRIVGELTFEDSDA